MNAGLSALSEREKETLRLLLGGHDAKSIANELGLSVHTINERLRDARRKLGVSSSREAARLLGEVERGAPNSLGDSTLGVSGASAGMGKKRQGAAHRLAWLTGGMFIMSLVIAAAVLTVLAQGSNPGTARPESSAGAQSAPTQAAAVSAAQEWVAFVDAKNWTESWRTAAAIFKSQASAEQFAVAVTPVREPLGAVVTRVLRSATPTNALPGAPAGEYQLIEFQTRFAEREVVETVILIREGASWRVAGYLIR